MSVLKSFPRLRKLEFASLLGLAFFLPMLEAPKNLLLGAFLVLWLFRCAKEGYYGGRWRVVDTVIATLWLSCLIGAALAGVHDSEWGGFGDVTRYLTVLWCLSRAGYERSQWLQLTAVLVTGSLLTLGYGAWLYYVSKQRMYLELYSVGHVNHTAVYLGILCSLLLTSLLAFWTRWSQKVRGLIVLALLLFFAGLVIGTSRAAIMAVLLVPLVLGVAWLPRSSRPLKTMILVLVGVGVIGVIGVANDFGVVMKQRRGFEQHNLLSSRDTIWRRALVITEMYPVFGAGIGNFSKVDDAAIAEQVTKDGKLYEAANYKGASHGHSLYFNTLAERGLVGSGIFFGALLACLLMLLKRRPKVADDPYVWTAWGASLSAWVVIVVAGVFNTSFHHEIAILAVLPLGAWLSMTQRT